MMTFHQPVQLTAAETALIDTYNERFSRLAGDAETTTARDNALETLKARGLPTRRIEAWHYTDLRRLLTSVPAYDADATSELRPPILAGSSVLPTINGRGQKTPNVDGLTVSPIAEMLSGGALNDRLKPRDEADTLGVINSALVSGGMALTLDADASLEAPVELQNLHGDGQTHTRFPVVIGDGASATIVERHTGDGEALVSSITDLELGKGAEITWLIVQEQPDGCSHLGQINITLGDDAKLMLFIMNSGAKLVRQEINVVSAGEGSDFQMRSINLLAGDTHTDVTMVLDHTVPNTTSEQVVRNVVTGEANGVFQGQIRVASIAQKTDARMACNTLLLSDDGAFSAKPELEIFADDVACGHGATVTEIDEAQLFYMMSRGIPEKDARRLLVRAFLAEVIEELENEALVEALETRLDDWFVEHG